MKEETKETFETQKTESQYTGTEEELLAFRADARNLLAEYGGIESDESWSSSRILVELECLLAKLKKQS